MAKVRFADVVNINADGLRFAVNYKVVDDLPSSVFKRKEKSMKEDGIRGYGVYSNGNQVFFSLDKEKALSVCKDMEHLNRYFKYSGGRVSVQGDVRQHSTSNPRHILWSCSWELGRMGWDAAPLAYDPDMGAPTEYVRYNEKESKNIQVLAPSAVLAIERAKLAATASTFLLRKNEVTQHD